MLDDITVLGKDVGLIDVEPDLSLVNEVLNLDIRNLDNITDVMLSKYIASLCQYNIYLNLTYNKHLILKRRLENRLNIQVYTFCKDNKLSAKTKKDKLVEACMGSRRIAAIKAELDIVIEKLTFLNDIMKYIDSYVNALKKDFMRRRSELGS